MISTFASNTALLLSNVDSNSINLKSPNPFVQEQIYKWKIEINTIKVFY